MSKLRVAVLGAGSFGRHHIRAVSEMPDAELTAVVDTDRARAEQYASEFGASALTPDQDVAAFADCAIVATPTSTHAAITAHLVETGLDVLVEKPIAELSADGDRLTRLAADKGRILQVGHLERFNPAILALEQVLSTPLFFEIHRLSVFTPRSLDIDVVLDLMIHDLDIVLSFTGQMPTEIRAAGISVLSPRVDIANVRLAFASGCIANLTASRVSTEKVRKLRLFQPGEYISVDFQRQDALRLAIQKNGTNPTVSQNHAISLKTDGLPEIGFESQNLPIAAGEPLKLELAAFFDAVRTRSQPKVSGLEATNALRVAEEILANIREHGNLVAATLRSGK